MRGRETFRVVTGGAHGHGGQEGSPTTCRTDGSATIEDLDVGRVCTVGLWASVARDILSSITRETSRTRACLSPWKKTSRRRPAGARLEASRTSATWAGRSTCPWPTVRGSVTLSGRPGTRTASSRGPRRYGADGPLEIGLRAFGAELDAGLKRRRGDMAWWKGKDRRLRSERRRTSRTVAEAGSRGIATLTRDQGSKSGVKRYRSGGEPIVTQTRSADRRRARPPWYVRVQAPAVARQAHPSCRPADRRTQRRANVRSSKCTSCLP